MAQEIKKWAYLEPGGERGETNDLIIVTEEEIMMFYDEDTKLTKAEYLEEWIKRHDADAWEY